MPFFSPLTTSSVGWQRLSGRTGDGDFLSFVIFFLYSIFLQFDPPQADWTFNSFYI